jgi:hypothetical protein
MRNKVIKVKINGHFQGHTAITYRANDLRILSEEEIVQKDFEYLLSVYPNMKMLFEILFNNLPEIELPLLINQQDYPEWVRRYVEYEFRTRQERKQ